MAKGDKGKYSKRGGRGSGSSRFHAVSAEEIEIRNNRIAELDAARSKRRAEEEGEEEESDNEKSKIKNEEEKEGLEKEEVEEDGTEKERRKSNKLDRSPLDTSMMVDKELPNAVSAKLKVTQGKNDFHDDDNEIEEEDGDRETEVVPIRTMTRKERELAEKEKAAAEYRRRHELGLTDEYKRDMEKLAEVKKRREEAARRVTEQEEMKSSAEKEARERAQKMGLLDEDLDEDDDKESDQEDKKKKKEKNKKSTPIIPKLDKIAIKKMKPTQLKEALKERSLDIQGNAKELMERLLEYEAAR